MPLRPIARLAPPQEPVQHHAVQQGLQGIVRMQHGFGHPARGVVAGSQRPVRFTEPVGFVVDHQITPASRIVGSPRDAQHRIQRAAEIPAQRLAAQRRVGEPVDIGRQRIPGRQVPVEEFPHVGEPDVRYRAPDVTAGQRKLEIQLAQAVPQRYPSKSQVIGQRPEWRVVHGEQPGRQIGGGDVHRPPERMPLDLFPKLALEIRGLWVGGLQHRVHQAAEFGPGRQIGHRGGQLGPRRRLQQRDLGHLVVEFQHFRFAVDPDGLLRRAHQPRVGGAPPGGVDVTMEMPGAQILRGRIRNQLAHRDDPGIFHDGPAMVLPLLEPFHRLGVGDRLRVAAVTDDGLSGLPVTQQPGQAAVGFVVARCPPRHDL